MPMGVYTRTEKHNRNISKALTGKKLSEEHRRKLSEARKGKTPWNKGRSGKGMAQWKDDKVKRICQNCKKEFEISQPRIDLGKGRFCSGSCRKDFYIKKNVQLVCAVCGKTFEAPYYIYKHGNCKYCSKKCQLIKLVESRTGIKMKDETKKKLREANLGKKHTEETKKKMSISRWRGGKTATQERRKNNAQLQLNIRISTLIKRSIKQGTKNGRHWEDLVGYSSEQLKLRLQNTIPNSHNWNDFLSGELQIDHILPQSAFNFTKPEHIDFQRCWALENLQLLPAKENRIKGAKLTESFQPGLAI